MGLNLVPFGSGSNGDTTAPGKMRVRKNHEHPSRLIAGREDHDEGSGGESQQGLAGFLRNIRVRVLQKPLQQARQRIVAKLLRS